MTEDIFISPHPDDIVYSCFGAFHESEKPYLLTVFSRSKYMSDNNLFWDEEKVTKIRVKEDRLFANMYKAGYSCLDFPDSSLTLNNIKEVTLYRNPNLLLIKKRLIDFLSRRNDYNLFIPIGNGWHNDHRDIHKIMMAMHKENNIHCNRLYLYEDMPYYSETSPSFSLTDYLKSEGLQNATLIRHEIDFTELKNIWMERYNIYKSQYDRNEFCKIMQYKYSHKVNRLQEIIWEIC